MIANIVARRYARALFTIGQQKGASEIETYGKDLAGFSAVLESNPDLLRIFRNPIFSIDEKKAIVEKILSKLDPNPTVRNFLFLLADKGRLSILPDIEAYFGVLLDDARGVVRGELVTATPLEQARQDEVLKQLAEQLGKELVLDFATDAGILGGVVLKVGDKILDASLRAQLHGMKEQIKRGE
ncbi:F-type H+-transporting ATPase subunit delta [Desulfobaculum xiamenense]|uniref:ATP synthase subunit delta n=1 Tax=Desulfobaculum xiamenense TaxID=995050 RepID=A0A846QH90_9BACT|nr:ATP synthase F1 subunit delta [Desulfobaculum xiamenense]NJB68186.1 F-type H+-transporting ATPase subunit delta [Desulfobaculum xiamenense]